MKMRRIDHVVLTVTDLEQSMRFYHEEFDMPVMKEQCNDDVITMRCGHQLIRLQKIDRPTTLKAANPTIGSADLCLVAGDSIDDIVHHLNSYYIDIIAGPIVKQGAEGEMTSLYVYDPDNNLIEIAVYKNK